MKRAYTLRKKSLDSTVFSKREALEDELESLDAKINKKNEYYKCLYEDKMEGVISQEEFIMLREKFTNEIEEYKSRIETIKESLAELRDKEDLVQTSVKIFEKYKHIDKLTKVIIDEFVDVVQIVSLNKETNERDIDIHLNIINLE